MKTFPLNLAAGATTTPAVPGSYVRVIKAVSAIRVKTSSGDDVFLELGLGIRFSKPFESLEISSVTAQQIELVIGDGAVDDSRLVGNVDITGGLDTREVMPATLTSAAVTVNTAAAVVAAANVDRRSVLIVNNGAAPIYVGAEGVTTATGVPVAALGGAVNLNVTAAIYAISGSAGNDVRVLQEVA